MIRFTRVHTLCAALTLLVNVAAAQAVTIPDLNLEQLVREALQLPNDAQIERGHMLQLRELDAGGDRGIVNLTGLEYATNIVTLSLYHNPIEDISPLASMTKMTGFNLWGCRIVDLSPLRNLQNLSWIVLGNNQISDISPLAGLINLTTLQVDSNQIVDISPLSNLTQLEELRLNRNAITDITPLTKLKSLQKLHLADNPFHDFSPLFELEGVELDIEISEEFNAIVEVPDPNLRLLIREALSLPEAAPLTQGQMQRLTQLDAGGDRGISNLTGLEYATNIQSLELYNNPIVDISPLAYLTKLTGFNLWGCRIVDLSPLRNLKNLSWIVLGNNQISDISPLSELTNLTSLNLSANQIYDISALVNLVNLQHLWIDQNSVEDVTILANLTQVIRLRADTNKIHDINPLVNLSLLEELWLNRNAITDITPLTGLKNLTNLYLADNPFYDFSPLFELEGVELDIEISEEFNVVVEVPDSNLRLLIRETLSLPQTVPLTQGQTQRLTTLDAGGDRGITDLTGLEYATNLQFLWLYHNPIVDIIPLAHLTRLEGLHLWGCRIVDLRPLRNLKNLRWIVLGNNQISDISALAELTNLTDLHLDRNQIMDFNPLANLGGLETLWIQANPGDDFSVLDMLSLTDFRYDEVCDTPPLFPLEERLNNRSYPSVVRAWDDVVGQDHLSPIERGMLHDLWFNPASHFEIRWDITPTALTSGLSTQLAGLPGSGSYDLRRSAQQLNPDTIILASIPIYGRSAHDTFPLDSRFWLRDSNGEIVKRLDGGKLHPLVNPFLPEVQDHFVNRILAIERCGVFDGVFLDEFYRNGTAFIGRHLYDASDEELIQVWVNILEAVRDQTRDNFLILMNANETKPTRFAEYINGVFMESFRDQPDGYSREWIMVHEDVLSWAENNLREPRINCLYGAGMSIEPPAGPNNLRWMRMFTTLSLTHSDGYVLYTDGQRGDPFPIPAFGTHHVHLWYDFWNADIGQPVGPKAQLYEDTDGLFIREFTKGWAVYNRSGKPHVVTLPERVQSVRSGLQHTQHAVPDLDGDIYLRLKPTNPADVNSDGVVNILDLVLVAQGFGTDKFRADVNGDGLVNILDLVFVANQF